MNADYDFIKTPMPIQNIKLISNIEHKEE